MKRPLQFLFCLSLTLALMPAAHAGEEQVLVPPEAADSLTGPEGRPEPALLMVFNRPVAILRESAFGYGPDMRAKAIMERINGLLDQEIYGPVTTTSGEGRTLVLIAGEQVFTLYPGDVDSLAGRTMEETVQETVHSLQVALEEAEIQSHPVYILKAVGKSFVATLVFALVMFVLLRLYRRTLPVIMAFEQRWVDRIAQRGFFFVAQLVRGPRWIMHLGFWIIILGITSQWISECLKWFPYTRPWGQVLQQNLFLVVGGIFKSALNALPDLLVIVVILVIARGIVAVLQRFFTGIESGVVRTEWMSAEAARATGRIVTVLIWLIAIVMIYPYIPGSSSNAFKGMTVFVGLLVSLGSSGVVGQFTSGLVLMYSRALRPGEYVRIGEEEGKVESLGFLSTKIRSFRNEEYHVPNAVILGTTIRNYSRLAEKGGLLVTTNVTIGYDVPWRQVHALLIAAAKATPKVCSEPAPFVLQTALSDFYVDYQLNACISDPKDRIRVLALLNANIQDQFNAHGVQIMSPAMRQEAAAPVIVPKEKWYTDPATPDSDLTSLP